MSLTRQQSLGARDHRGPSWTPQGLFLRVVKADSRVLERKEVRPGCQAPTGRADLS